MPINPHGMASRLSDVQDMYLYKDEAGVSLTDICPGLCKLVGDKQCVAV